MAQALTGEMYEFQARPEVVKPRANKYRPEPVIEEQIANANLPSNIMFDKRVIRGNTYANSQTQGDKKLMTLKQFKKPQSKAAAPSQPNYANPTTPRPLPNRHNMEVQTEEYIETLADKPPEQEMDAQTDYYIDKPPQRLFKPKKNGFDKDTQIWEGDLFDFDQEVEPILQVLMNKTLEQSRMEVLEEEELKLMKLQQKEYETERNPYLSEMQRLEQVELRLDEEQQRRNLQYQIVLKQQTLGHQKIICRTLAKKIIKPLKSSLFAHLEDLGVFRDPLEAALYSEFVPWIVYGIQSELHAEDDTEISLESTLKVIEQNVKRQHAQSIIDRHQMIADHYAAIEQRKRDKEEAKRREEEARLQAIEEARLLAEEEERRAQEALLEGQEQVQAS